MCRLKRWLIWIYRWRHCRGFGVQSPSDYGFIRYVINEHYPYYAYDELENKFPDLSHIHRKKAELLFRISNWIQSPSVLLLSEIKGYSDYILAGCHKTIVRNDNNFSNDDNGKLTIVSPSSITEDKLQVMVSHLKDGDILVMDDLDTRLGRMLWKKIIVNERSTISFDLYYMGIVMNIDKRYKHEYIVNF